MLIKKIWRLLPLRTRTKIKERLQILISPYYYGSNYYCNCCKKNFRKFLPAGSIIIRMNVRCPRCLVVERTRVLDLYLDKELKIYQKEAVSILHFAPEWVLSDKLKNIKGVEYVDGDINPAHASNIIDITDIKFPENYFDYIVCSHVLGHVPDEPAAISELYRVLKNSGVALIMTVTNGEENTFEDENIRSVHDRLKYYGEPDLCRLHGYDFKDRLEKKGFKTQVIDYRTHFSNEIRTKYSLGDGKREVIYRCRK